MLAFLPHLLEYCDSTIGTVLHIGAGVGRELEVYQAMQFRQVVAVEADPTLFDKLSRKSKSYNHVQTKNAWVGVQSGETPVHCFANPRFNSLLAPDQLVAHFANLKQSEQKTVKAMGVNELIAELGPLDSEQSHALILDVQGAEALLLEACTEDSLAQFEWVVVRTSQEPLYKDSVTANALAKTLATRDLTLRFSDDENAPFIEHYYQRDQSAITIRQTEAKLQESQKINARCAEIEQANKNAKKDLADLAVKLEKQSGSIAIKDQALKEKTEQAEQFEQQVAQLTNTLKHQIIDCEQASQNLTAKQALLDKTQQQVDYLSKQLEEKTKQAEESNKQLQEQNQALVDELDAQKQAVQAQQEETKQAEESNKQLQEQNHALVEQLDAQKQAVQEQQEKAKLVEEASKRSQEEKQALVEQLDAQKQTVQAQQEKTKQAEEASKQSQEEKQALVEQLDAQKQALVDQLEVQKQAAIESTKSEEAKANELKSELAATKKQLEQQTQWHHQNKDRVESLNKQISELKQQILERQKASDMAIKLQTKAQVDLDDLRNKYQAKNHNEQQLVELVKELRVKLKQAAEFYHYLENNYPELAKLDYTETKDELVKTKKSAKKS